MSTAQAVIVGVVPALLVFIANLVINARSLKASQPKTDAEVRALSGQGSREDVRISLEAMNSAITAATARAERAEAAASKTNERVTQLEHQLDDASHDADLQGIQLRNEQERNKLLDQSLRTSEEHLRIARQQVDILTEHARRVDRWWQQHYVTADHTDDHQPPPRLINLDPQG